MRPIPGYLNIDNRKEVPADLLMDITEPWEFEDCSVDEVRAFDILEHIPIGKTIFVMEEIYRILKPEGILEVFIPDCEYGQGAFMDPTHQSFWCENSWLYYTNDGYRNLYGIKAKFKIKTFERVETSKELRIYHIYAKLGIVKDKEI